MQTDEGASRHWHFLMVAYSLVRLDPESSALGTVRSKAFNRPCRSNRNRLGWIQKEAFFLDTYCVTLRDETEWVETVEAGWNVIVGGDEDVISAALSADWRRPTEKPEFYGDGNVSKAVREAIESNVD